MFGIDDALIIGGIAAGSVGGSLYSSHYNNKVARSNLSYQLRKQYKYAQKYALNSPSWNVNGLRNAGLNPILAVSNGVNLGANIPNASISTPTMDMDPGGAIADGIDALSSKQNSEANMLNADSNSLTAHSNANLADANIDLTKAKTSVELLKAQQIKNDLKGGGYKNPIVNDINRGLKDTAKHLGGSFNSPTSKDSSSAYIDFEPKLDEKESRTFETLKKEYGPSVARELFIPAKRLDESKRRLKSRSLFVR